jgi:hypothetical protein
MVIKGYDRAGGAPGQFGGYRAVTGAQVKHSAAMANSHLAEQAGARRGQPFSLALEEIGRRQIGARRYRPPPAQAQAQAQPAQAQAQPLPPERPPLLREDSAMALNMSAVTRSAPLRLMKPPSGVFTWTEPGPMAEATRPIVFSVQPAKDAATSPRLVRPPTAGPPELPPEREPVEGTPARPGRPRTQTGR